MNSPRRDGGRETWHRLREWDQGQTPSERLAARILSLEGYTSIDPSHPLGGRDGGKDIVCVRDERNFIVACYFPRGQQTHLAINKKFADDVTAAKKQGTNGVVFFTNQEVVLSERESLKAVAEPLELDLYHLERLAALLDRPGAYGLRLEFLGIEMTKEEQISAFQGWSETVDELKKAIAALSQKQAHTNGMKTVTARQVGGVTTSIYASLFGSKIKTCTCGEVFEARQPNMATTAYVHFGATEVVTCPNCGRTFAF